MRTLAAALAAMALLAGSTRTLDAQDEGDFAAFFALVLTPVGALPPLPPLAATTDALAPRTFDVRYGQWSVEGGDPQRTIGLGTRFGAGRGHAGLTVGYSSCDGCDGVLMVGADLTMPLLRPAPAAPGAAAFSVGLQPAIGFGTALGDGEGTAISGSVHLPIAVAAGQPDGVRLVPFLAPGFGFGRMSGGGDSESGFRFMLGGGVAVANLGGGLGLHAGFEKIFIEDGPTQFGVGLTLGGR